MESPSLLDRLPAGNVLGIVRTLKGWTQRELARRIGVSPGDVSTWELSRKKPAPEARDQLEKELGIPADSW